MFGVVAKSVFAELNGFHQVVNSDQDHEEQQGRRGDCHGAVFCVAKEQVDQRHAERCEEHDDELNRSEAILVRLLRRSLGKRAVKARSPKSDVEGEPEGVDPRAGREALFAIKRDLVTHVGNGQRTDRTDDERERRMLQMNGHQQPCGHGE